MLSGRETLEAALLAGTSAHIASRLVTAGFGSGGWGVGAASLAGLTLLAICQEFIVRETVHFRGLMYETKAAASQGIALGTLSLPWIFGALWVSVHGSSGDPVFSSCAFKSTVASSAAMLVFFLLEPHRTGGRIDTAAKVSRSGQNSLKPMLLGSYALLVACALQSELTGVGKFVGDVPLLRTGCIALNAGGCVMVLHLLLAHLPRSFTLGEAMVVAQTITLLLTDVASIAVTVLFLLATATEGWPPHAGGAFPLQTLLGGRDVTHVFTEVLLVAVAGVCMIAARLFAAMRRTRKLGRERRGRGSAAEAAPMKGNDRMAKQQRTDTVLTADSSGRAEAARAPVGTVQSCLPAWAVEYRNIWGDATALLLVVAVAAAAAVFPAAWVLRFALASRRRVALLGYWGLLLAGALPCMDWVSRRSGMQTILVRKGYHLLALMLFSPALLLEPQLLAMGLGIACALLLVVEAVRVTRVPWLGPRIHSFMTSFIDERDSGLLLVSHFSLLVGMAAPVWLCVGGVGLPPLDLAAAFAGITILGIADSAASALGRRLGRHNILGTGKTLEGSLGGVACNVAFWWVLSFWLEGERTLWGFLYASVASCALEAATTQLDNIFLPLHHLALLLL